MSGAAAAPVYRSPPLGCFLACSICSLCSLEGWWLPVTMGDSLPIRLSGAAGLLGQVAGGLTAYVLTYCLGMAPMLDPEVDPGEELRVSELEQAPPPPTPPPTPPPPASESDEDSPELVSSKLTEPTWLTISVIEKDVPVICLYFLGLRLHNNKENDQ